MQAERETWVLLGIEKHRKKTRAKRAKYMEHREGLWLCG